MRLISWNVNGIRAVAKKGFRESFFSFDADVVCLQETKATPDQYPKEAVDIPGYKGYFNAAERKGYSGTALYSRKEPRSVSFGLGEDRFDHEGRTIEADFDDFVLYNIYFPNGGQGPERLEFKLAFYDCFLEKVSRQIEDGRQIVVCGDVNTAHREIDLANPAANAKNSGFLPEERAYMDIFAEKGLVDTFRMLYPDASEKYTWWSYKTFARDRNVGWRIDYFFTDEILAEQVSDSGMLSNVMGSDHCPIYLDLL
ncbi:MAG: exodeoxyribonuclease III [Clostridiales bacterium]|nr:exodeoxyribonuclease III [Clostridiales bacterium]